MIMWVILVAYYPVVMHFVKSEQSAERCVGVAPDVHAQGDMLINESGLLKLMKGECPEIVGKRLKDLDYASIERQIEKHPVVRRCEAYPTIDGRVHVEIYQRQPIMRVFGSEGSYYMDAEGYKITAKSDMRTHTLIVNGSVNTMLDTEGLVRLCRYIDRDKFWHSMIEQVNVTPRHEYVLVPRVGDHVIEFGTADDMEQKFSDLHSLYKNGWDEREWNIYKRVNVKYKGQIVCTKR